MITKKVFYTQNKRGALLKAILEIIFVAYQIHGTDNILENCWLPPPVWKLTNGRQNDFDDGFWLYRLLNIDVTCQIHGTSNILEYCWIIAEVTGIVREHYLRDDLSCGSEICKICPKNNLKQTLSSNPLSKTKLVEEPHYIFLDTNVILDQIDALEEPFLQNIVVLTTVLTELKNKSAVVYNRFKEIISDLSRNFYIFVNEHHKDTYVEKAKGETDNERNDRAIRVAAHWYQKHTGISSVLITDDRLNRQQIKKMGIKSYSMSEYVEGCDCASMTEKLNSKRWGHLREDEESEQLFPNHLELNDVQKGLRDNALVKGTYYQSRENCLEGNVNTIENTILIIGRKCINRAIDGDIVAVKVLPKEEWKAPTNIILQPDNEEEDEEEKLKEELKDLNDESKQMTGQIVAIINRKYKTFCGILQSNNISESKRNLFIPSKRYIPKIRIETKQAERLSSMRIVVTIDTWPRNSRYPHGHFVRALGKIGDRDTENEVLLLEHDVPFYNFSESVLECLPSLPWKINPEELEKRKDLRDYNICSVDPPGCTDIDDALHCVKLSNKNYQVGVHIADVTYFIRPGTAIDKEAALRSNTVYLTDKRIDMVPDLLSSNLCSLRSDGERFAFSCMWELTPEAEIVKVEFFKSIIYSKASLTYAAAQAMIDDSTDTSALAESLRNLNNLAKKLKESRIKNGALVLASPEIRFHVDSETNDPIDVKQKQLLETNSMVEEFMLLANISVAKKILQEFPDCAILRCHPQPPPGNFEPIIKAAQHQGFEIKVATGKELAESLDKAVVDDNSYYNIMLRILTTRSMMQAVYFCSGMQSKDQFFHYGLAASIYTHFTSPIRRYADILVHRLLAVIIGADSTYPELMDKKILHNLCTNMNYRHRMAQYAGRASVALYTNIYFRGKIADEEGYILCVRKNALQILIPKYGLEGNILLNPNHKKGEISKFVFNPENDTQCCGNVILHTFDRVTVQISLDDSNVQHEKVIMKLVEPCIPEFSVPPIKAIGEENIVEHYYKYDKNVFQD